MWRRGWCALRFFIGEEKEERTIWILRDKFSARNNNMQSDWSRDGRTVIGSKKNLLVLTPPTACVESSKSKPNFVASTWNINSNLLLEEDSMICKHVSTVKDVLFMSYVTAFMWKLENKRFIIQNTSRNNQSDFRWFLGSNETFKLVNDNIYVGVKWSASLTVSNGRYLNSWNFETSTCCKEPHKRFS